MIFRPLRRGSAAKHRNKFRKILYQFKGHFASSLKILGLALFAVTLPYSIVFAADTKTNNAMANLVLSKSAPVVIDSASDVAFSPGLSLEQQNLINQQKEMEQNWRDFDKKTGLVLDQLSYEEMKNRINRFLQSQSSPMVSSAEQLIKTSSDLKIDPRLLVGIAGAESTYGLHIPAGSHNPFGLGPGNIYSTWADCYVAEAQFLHDHYISAGVFAPKNIGPSYTGTGSTSWGQKVAAIMLKI